MNQVKKVGNVLLLTQTLFANGYIQCQGRRTQDGLLLTYEKNDRLGASVRYLIVLADRNIEESHLEEFRNLANRESASLIIIGETEDRIPEPVYTFDRFISRFGGPVSSLVPLRTTFEDEITALGQNELPRGLSGYPNELFEEYVGAALQFMTGRLIIRYGKDRRFESVPDGIAISCRKYVLYDTKASKAGFKFEQETLRQFADYVEDFNKRYGTAHGTPYSFVCFSGLFRDSIESLHRRSQELYAKCSVPLACFDSRTVASICRLLSKIPKIRQAIDWERIFASPIVQLTDVQTATDAAERDGLANED